MGDIVTEALNNLIKEEYRERLRIEPYGMLWVLRDFDGVLIQGTKDLILKYLKESELLQDNM